MTDTIAEPQAGWLTLDRLTFLTAWLGYLAVTVTMLTRFGGGSSAARWATAITMLVVVTVHVLLVWGHRFGFDPSRAFAGGVAPAVLLHVLYLLIVVHALGHGQSTFMARLIYPAWVLVTILGMPGAFLQPFLHWLRIPMITTFAAGIIGLAVLA